MRLVGLTIDHLYYGMKDSFAPIGPMISAFHKKVMYKIFMVIFQCEFLMR